ncbi:MarR family transcriptional regulator [Archangium minus]|uniref:MarR family transcriptional regulator n=2 Tax=Archangium minus TaxID=83450 RepID=A0ABY9X6H3_9BACT|nr:MarR family transcriptional regulator [Archangium violaceum]WNG50997.1 MarR family transcriptional regulator [Archangium minus]
MTQRSNLPLDHALRMLGMVARMYRWAEARAQARPDQDLSLRQLSALYGIRDGISSPGQLARRMGVTPAVVTGLIDRLQQRGYVRRDADPNDRRRFRLSLTESGLAVGDALGQALGEELAAQFENISKTELESLGRTLLLMERALSALEARMPTSLPEGAGEADDS